MIRFYSDNIGLWFFHCHVEVHATEGMATLIQEGSIKEIRESVNWNEMHTCNKGYDLNIRSNGSSFVSNFVLVILLIKLILSFNI